MALHHVLALGVSGVIALGKLRLGGLSQELIGE
jgi:hypothetical protein